MVYSIRSIIYELLYTNYYIQPIIFIYKYVFTFSKNKDKEKKKGFASHHKKHTEKYSNFVSVQSF